ncbi:MAG: hypothetical protein HQ556_09965 [Candidatus Marinimicrobia bacterium]|nr:hypothetical protein [Candidatus Neomarinimicrobiota bacterium]
MKLLTTVILLLSGGLIFAQDAKPEYIGSKKCKMCHNKEVKGAQYSNWEATAHANTFDILLTDAAKKIGEKLGLSTTPDQAGECLQCHVTGWGSASGYQLTIDETNKKLVSKNDALKSVSCEACHGPGSLYKGKKVMQAITDGTTDGASLGLTYPDEKTCRGCHNEKSPTFKSFNFEERAKKIAHPYPQQ